MKSYGSVLRDDRFAIFLLHGVVREQRHRIRNYTRKHLPLDEFVLFLKELKSSGTPVSMDDIAEASLGKGALPKRAFAITFDDGFRNNVTIAAAVLDDIDIPATFYVTTGFVQSKHCSWTDRIEAALEQSATVQLRGIADEIDGRYESIQEKIGLMDRIRTYVKGNGSVDPYAFADAIIQRTGVRDHPFDDQLDSKVTWQDVRALAGHDRFTVGGHSHTHRILSFLPDHELEQEISTSVRLLSETTGEPVRHYSYPEGLAHCYSQSVIDSLKCHGIMCCPTAEDGTNRLGDSLFHLKRIFVL